VRILLVEDDEVLTSVLVNALQHQRYTVDAIADGRSGLEYAAGGTYDLLLIDVGLPLLDGISLCQQLRSDGCTTPILLMTAKDAPDEKIRGLDAGADDYLTKPLDLAELQARLRALLRRKEVAPASVLQAGQLRLDPVGCDVTYGGVGLKLTPKEYSLLELFFRNPGRVFSRGQIIEHLWTFDDPPLEDSVKAHVKGLRRQLKKAGADGWVENVYGLGYKFSPKLDEEQVPEKQVSEKQVSEKQVSEELTAQVQGDPETVQQQFDEAMKGLWRQHHGSMAQRFDMLQQAALALERDQLTDTLRQSAAVAAHKLAGVLGMFGRDEGSQVARELETMLSAAQVFAARQASPVAVLVERLAHILDVAADVAGDVATDIPAADIPADSKSPNPFLRSDFSSVSFPTVSFSSVDASGTPRILAVDDDPVFRSALVPMLSPWGLSVTTLGDPKKLWEALNAVVPDLLLLDIEMPECDGLELCEAIRSDVQWQSLPLIFLTARQNASAQVFAAGADDYVLKPVLGPELITRINNRLERARLLKALQNRDTITGLANQSQAQRSLEQLMQGDRPYIFALLRLANLSQINLNYGHSMGHQVLKAWGDELRFFVTEAVRFPWKALPSQFPQALLSYWGNGEFVVALPDVSKLEASEALSPVLKAFRQRVFTGQRTDIRFQAQYKVGLCAFPDEGDSLGALYRAAYAASE
jgi:DNA-binding response OmpR family regulator/HPt (histidine-containing phosphotransfer) domain-containing protein